MPLSSYFQYRDENGRFVEHTPEEKEKARLKRNARRRHLYAKRHPGMIPRASKDQTPKKSATKPKTVRRFQNGDKLTIEKIKYRVVMTKYAPDKYPIIILAKSNGEQIKCLLGGTKDNEYLAAGDKKYYPPKRK